MSDPGRDEPWRCGMSDHLFDLLYGDVIAARAAFDRLTKSPARRSPTSPAGEPVLPPVPAGECRTPGSTAVVAAAARESTELVELSAGAISDPRRGREGAIRGLAASGVGPAHEPDRPTAPGLPPRPIDYPRPTVPSVDEIFAAADALGLDPARLRAAVVRRAFGRLR